MAPHTDVFLMLSTAPNREVAEGIANKLVGERLAACVTLVDGATSIYRWEGEVKSDRETLMVLKTARSRVSALKERLLALHPYDTPECLAFEAADGSAAYLAWVGASTTP